MLLFQKLLTKKLFSTWELIVKNENLVKTKKNHRNVLKLSPELGYIFLFIILNINKKGQKKINS